MSAPISLFGRGERVCSIVGAGDFFGMEKPLEGDLCIAADGGYSYLTSLGITPDICVGDFDSLGFQPVHPNIVRLKKEKDDTDMFEAIKLGIERGYREFRLWGGTGGRIEHTAANMQHIAYLAARGLRGYLIGENSVMTAILDSSIAFDAGASGYISVFSHSDTSTGVYERGLKYSLSNATLTSDFPLGVSNEFTGQPSEISVERGILMICVTSK